VEEISQDLAERFKLRVGQLTSIKFADSVQRVSTRRRCGNFPHESFGSLGEIVHDRPAGLSSGGATRRPRPVASFDSAGKPSTSLVQRAVFSIADIDEGTALGVVTLRRAPVDAAG
jgi:hypothetical protein